MQPASLYYFWKLNEAKPNDIDAVVNANALYYLWLAKQSGAISDSIYEAAVVPVANYLMDIIREDREELCDKWHLSPFNLYYAVSRNLFAGVEPFRSIEDLLVRKVLRHARLDGMIGSNVLETALAVCILLNCSSRPEEMFRAIDKLLASQEETGCWTRLPLYYGGPKKYFGWGSEELTTGFCLEALIRCHHPSMQSGAGPYAL